MQSSAKLFGRSIDPMRLAHHLAVGVDEGALRDVPNSPQTSRAR